MKAFTVYCSSETGELTRIAETPAFAEENTLFRADVLKDIALAFTALYADAYDDMMRDFEAYAPKGEVQ